MLSAVFLFPSFLAPKPADWLALAFQERSAYWETRDLIFVLWPKLFTGLDSSCFSCPNTEEFSLLSNLSIFEGQKKSIRNLVSYATTMKTKVKMSTGIPLEHALIITNILRKKMGTVLMFKSLCQSFLIWISFCFLFWWSHNPRGAPGRRGSLLRILICFPCLCRMVVSSAQRSGEFLAARVL